jgi:starch phosphorylase
VKFFVHKVFSRLTEVIKKGDSAQNLPENLQALHFLAGNTYWIWNRKIRQIFERIDPAAWEGLDRNPVALLSHVTPVRMEELSKRDTFVASVAEAAELQKQYLSGLDSSWFSRNYGILGESTLIAYFSMEFAVAPCVKIYSGGLGVLAADHLKSASDLGLPLVGVGLLYKRGYFSQSLTHDGWQSETYPENEPLKLPIEPIVERGSDEPFVISVPIADRQVRVRAWKLAVGRVSLYLLDSDLPGLNSKEDCEITSELYGGDIETRMKQEIVLGFGGAKLLRALGLQPSLYHMNEGHSAFVTLENIKIAMEENEGRKLSFSEAIEQVKSRCVFTTHTPVPAGIDVFPRELVEKYLGWYCAKVGITVEELLALGSEANTSGLNMAILALRLSRDVNTVSKLHEEVASKNWESFLVQEGDGDARRKMLSITNGIHVPTWTADSMAELFEEYVGSGWEERITDEKAWQRILEIPDEILWMVRNKEREGLVRFVRQHFAIAGSSLEPNEILNPNALTIGFARRFATYKRASLILSDKDRLAALAGDSSRPIQIIFAGKAHPRDFEGKKLIHEIIEFSKALPGRIVFLNNYDLSIAKSLVQGVDVWLNNPRRPLEASGTSGMKAAANGVLNLSVLDGWWDEAYDPSLGWAIGSREVSSDPNEQDRLDADSLYTTLEQKVIPEFYDRGADGVPTKWVERMKNSICKLAPRFNTRRMVKEYAELSYFKHQSKFAGRMNRSELGVQVLERFQPDWENRDVA